MPSNMNWSFRAKKFHGQINLGKPELMLTNVFTKGPLKALMYNMHCKTLWEGFVALAFPPS